MRGPGHIEPGQTSDEIMHVTDWFTTILRAAGLSEPDDRVIDGVNQLGWLTGQTASQREGYIYWIGPQMYGVKWHNFKLVLVAQKYMQDAAAQLPTPRIINLATDPQERETVSLPYLHTWTATANNARTIRANLGYVRPEKRTVDGPARAAAVAAKGGRLSRLSHRLTGRYRTIASLPDTRQDSDLRIRILTTIRTYSIDLRIRWCRSSPCGPDDPCIISGRLILHHPVQCPGLDLLHKPDRCVLVRGRGEPVTEPDTREAFV